MMHHATSPNYLTFEVSQDEMSWLKDDALSNMLFISVTFEVSQDEMSRLKLAAFLNIHCIDIALEKFHDPMLSLKERMPEKTWEKFTTLDTFHLPMGHPYVVAKDSASSGLYSAYFSTALRSS